MLKRKRDAAKAAIDTECETFSELTGMKGHKMNCLQARLKMLACRLGVTEIRDILKRIEQPKTQPSSEASSSLLERASRTSEGLMSRKTACGRL